MGEHGVRATIGKSKAKKNSYAAANEEMRWSLSGFEPTSVSRVAPDWDLSNAPPTELQRRGVF